MLGLPLNFQPMQALERLLGPSVSSDQDGDSTLFIADGGRGAVAASISTEKVFGASHSSAASASGSPVTISDSGCSSSLCHCLPA